MCRSVPAWGMVQDAGGVDVGVVDANHDAGGFAAAAAAAADSAGAGASATTAGACDDDDDVPCYLARMVPSPGRFPTLRFAVAGYRVSTFRIRSLVAKLLFEWTMRWP